MPGPDPAAGSCPVCGRPAGQQRACADCGWTLHTEPALGPVTARLRRDFDERLRLARQQADARVAAVITATPARYHAWIRGGPPDAAGWAAARQTAEAVTAGAVDGDALRARLAGELQTLDGTARAIIAEAGTAGITVAQAWLSAMGMPELQVADPLRWETILPMLSADPDERDFQLAGALAQFDHDLLWATLRPGLPELPGRPALVICRPAGWTVLERAATELHDRAPGSRLIRAAKGGPGLGALLGSLAAEAPLRHPYRIAVAVADPRSRSVRVATRPLFGAGAVPGAEAQVPVRRVPGDRGHTTLAVLSGNGDGTRVVSLWSAPQPASSRYQVRAVLERAGQVQFTDPSGAIPHQASWTEVRASIPDRLDTTLGPLDVVCAVEMAGPPELVRQRRQVAREFLQLLRDEYPSGGLLRAGVLGCRDHLIGRTTERRRVVDGVRLGPVSAALTALSGLDSHEIGYPHAAPIEDMLVKAAELLYHSHEQGRSARLLLVAGRRPHPSALTKDKVSPCPLGWNWRRTINQLTGSLATDCVVVADEVPRGPWAALWRDLGPQGVHGLRTVTARQLAENLGLLARDAQRIPIPLADVE